MSYKLQVTCNYNRMPLAAVCDDGATIN